MCNLTYPFILLIVIVHLSDFERILLFLDKYQPWTEACNVENLMQ